MKRIDKSIDYAGLTLMGLLSLGYFLRDRRFAELHINFSFLDFPVFIGEILLFLCLALLIIKWAINPQKINRWYYLLFVYFGFVLTKALWGYFKWGPLALRHAALFYYPLFAVFGYYFYRKNFLDNKKKLLFVALIIFIFKFTTFYDYAFLTYFITALILIKGYGNKIARYCLLLVFLAASPYVFFFKTSRTFLVANIASIMFLIFTLLISLRIRKIYKTMIFPASILLLAILIWNTANKNYIQSLIDYRAFVAKYRMIHNLILANKANFKMGEIKEVKLYNKEPPLKFASKINPASKTAELLSTASHLVLNTDNLPAAAIEKLPSEPEERVLPSAVSLNNSIFRIFLWQDMVVELVQKKPVFGFDFGKPFRSKNIEIAGFANGEWSRDGWITAHNSYLEIIYRTGALGIFFIGIIFMLLFIMIKKFLLLRSISGILLCGVLINWIVAANFLVILELPYNAIPFWSLFGIVLRIAFVAEKGENELT